MAGTRQVHLVGDDEPWDVLCETSVTMILVNPRARARRAQLEQQRADAERGLAALRRPAVTDVSGNAITGP